ncbi:TetR/AcrR family transcriptional regulator [Enterovirga rhinocerotis]|uniref:TetR family transcriptional regulator n=1 Tax=Enterovirga rhinocerotis TaxID=1339210 RepID=A0A4R7C7E8_9HYPH|nr:TetR/AcrR family transcriptional regulator [Enterovirga rhinocerotis]TDR93175.1 TetR family transcriptional regulator [Enterovirga rhinocerotis]
MGEKKTVAETGRRNDGDPAGSPRPRPRAYHHGNLVDAIVQATISLIEERGTEAVSLREAARRAGVSSAAPFRHFPNKAALMAAVAEQAMERLTASIEAALAETSSLAPMARFEALGRAYLGWAFDNPTHFQVISSRALVDLQASPRLRQQNEAIRLTMTDLLESARRSGELRTDISVDQIVLSARAFGYGLARMHVDGHLPEWHPSEAPKETAMSALASYLRTLRREA